MPETPMPTPEPTPPAAAPPEAPPPASPPGSLGAAPGKTPPKTKKKRSCLGCFARVCLIGIVLLALLAALAPYLIPTDHIRRMVIDAVEKQTQRTCTFEGLEVNLYAGGVVAEGFTIAGAEGSETPFCRIQRAIISLDLSTLPNLLEGKPATIREIEIEGGSVFLERDASGALNAESLFASPADAPASDSTVVVPFIPRQVVFSDITLGYRDSIKKVDTRIRFPKLTLTTEDINRGVQLRGTLEILEKDAVLGTVGVEAEADFLENFEPVDPTGTADLTLKNMQLRDLLKVLGRAEAEMIAGGRADGTLQLTLRGGTPHISGHLRTGELALNLPDRSTPVTIPGTKLTLDLTTDLSGHQYQVSTFAVESPLGVVRLDGSFSFVNTPGAPLPLQARSNLHADISLATLGSFVRENKFAIMPADMDGQLVFTGPVEIKPDDLIADLQLQSDALRVDGPNFRQPLALTAKGKLAYTLKEDRLDMSGFRLQSAIANAAIVLRANGLWRDDRALAMRVVGDGDLAEIATQFRLSERLGGMALQGKVDLDLTAQTDKEKRIHLTGSLAAADQQTLQLTTPAPVRETVDLGAARVTLQASFRPGPKPSENVITLRSLEIASAPMAGRFAGNFQPGNGSWSLGYACRFHPVRARTLLARTLPYDLGSFVRELTLTGQAQYDVARDRLIVQNATAKGKLVVEQDTFTFEMMHDGEINPQEGRFQTRRMLAQVTQGKQTVCEAAVELDARGPFTAPVGEVRFNLSGAIKPIHTIASRFLPLPRSLHPNGSVTVEGSLHRDNNGVGGRWDGTVRQLRLTSDQGWTVQEREARSSMHFQYADATRTLRIRKAEIATDTGDLLLGARGGMILKEGGIPNRHTDWTFEKGTRLTLLLDGNLLKRTFTNNGQAMELPSGELKMTMDPTGSLESHRLVIAATVNNLTIPGTSPRFPRSADMHAEFQVQHGTLPAKESLLTVDALRVNLPGMVLQTKGRLQKIQFGEDDSLDLGKHTAFAFRFNAGRHFIAALMSAPPPDDPGNLQSTILQGQILLPGAAAGSTPLQKRLLQGVVIRNGALQIDEIRAENRTYKDIRAAFSMQKGLFRLDKGYVHFGGPVYARAAIDFNPELARCELRFRTPGVAMSESIQQIGLYTLFTDGTIIAPAKQGEESAFLWRGLDKESFDKSLTIPRTSLLVQDMRLFTRKEETDWNRIVQQRLPAEIANELVKEIKRYEQSREKVKSFLTKEVHYETFYVDYEIKDQVLIVHDLQIKGGNTADFAVTGKIGFDDSLDLVVMPIGNMQRTLQSDALMSNPEIKKALDQVDPRIRAIAMRLIPEWLEKKARQRKIRLPVSGTTQNPVTHPEKLVDILLVELEKDLPDLLRKAAEEVLKNPDAGDLLGEDGARILEGAKEALEGEGANPEDILRNLF